MRIIKEIGRNPPIDWITIVFLSGVISISLIVGGVFLYRAVTGGNIQGEINPTSDSIKNIDKESLSKVSENFSKKEETSQKTKTSYSGLPDPSM